MRTDTIRVGFFQYAPTFGDVAANLSKVTSSLHNIDADIVVLPELAFTGYLFKDRAELASLAENPVNSPTVFRLTELCRENSFLLVTGFAEKDRDRIFNSALAIGKEGILHTYRKLHLFNTEK